MKTIIIAILLMIQFGSFTNAQYQVYSNENSHDYFLNPVFAGDYSDPSILCDGEGWNKIENSIDVSGFNHNALSGFLSLRIGLCSTGEGKVRFKNFVYKPIK